MASPAALTDTELKEALISLGATVGPITATTRSIYEKQLEKRRAAAASGGSTAAKPRTASKSPSRTTKKTVTTSTVEFIKKKVPERRSGVGIKATRSEPEDTAPEVQDFVNEKDAEALNETREAPGAKILPPSLYSTLPHDSPAKTRDATIYPGLSPLISIKPSAVSKLAERKPTPPRGYKVVTETSYTPQSTSKFGTSGIFSDITADFSTESKKRPTYTFLPDDKTSNSSFRRNVNEDFEYDEDDDDDHMESSRILEPDSTRPSIMSSVSRLPSYAYGAMTAPFKHTVQTPQYGALRTDYRRTPVVSRGFQQGNGSDVANFLLYTMSGLFLLLLLGYIGVVHSEKVLDAGVAVAGFAVDTVGFLYTYAILPCIIIAVVGGAATALYILNQKLLSVRAERRKKVFDLVEKITDIIRDSNADGQDYIAEPHVRDMLIPPSKRTRDSEEWRRWQEAVNFINQNDSRVSTESRIINGVECAVWRWVPANKAGWQGSAFDGRTQLNVPDHALSHCLKLRGMFPSPQERDGADVGRALVQKLTPVRPLHVHVEAGSKEGVVFVRFVSLPDCKAAFTTLHGTWFNGHLVSAKYLRDERYEQRFPSAPRNAPDVR